VNKQIIICPLIREFIHNPDLGRTCSFAATWNTFKSLCANFNVIHKVEKYREIISDYQIVANLRSATYH
jgi:hypothetical protein